jgi:hypothetical protein
MYLQKSLVRDISYYQGCSSAGTASTRFDLVQVAPLAMHTTFKCTAHILSTKKISTYAQYSRTPHNPYSSITHRFGPPPNPGFTPKSTSQKPKPPITHSVGRPPRGMRGFDLYIQSLNDDVPPALGTVLRCAIIKAKQKKNLEGEMKGPDIKRNLEGLSFEKGDLNCSRHRSVTLVNRAVDMALSDVARHFLQGVYFRH